MTRAALLTFYAIAGALVLAAIVRRALWAMTEGCATVC